MTQKQLQEQKTKQVTELLFQYDSVVGAYLYGSYAKGENTPFSDIDLVVIFSDEGKDDIKEVFERVKETEKTLSTLYQLYDHESLLLFKSGVRLDLSMIDEDRFEDWTLVTDQVKVLIDKEGIIEQKLKDSTSKEYNHPSWNEEEGSYIDWYFWMFRQAYCYALQSKLVDYKSLDKLKDAQSSIHSVRNKLIETLYYISGKKEYLSRIDKEIQDLLQESYTRLEVDEIISAIRALTRLYKIVIKQYCEKEGKEFPNEKYESLWELYDMFDTELGNLIQTPNRVSKEEWAKLWVAKINGWTISLAGDQHVLGWTILFPPDEIKGSLVNLPKNRLIEFQKIGHLIEKVLSDKFGAEWFNYRQAGNVVKNLHIHLIPRYSKVTTKHGYEFTDEGWGHPVKFRKASELPDKEIVFKLVKEMRFAMSKVRSEDLDIIVCDT